MNYKLTILGVAAAFSFAACETTTTNANRVAANTNNAVVVNANNTTLTTNTNTTTTNTSATTNRSAINYNGTSKEYESERTTVESEAKSTGRTIGTGANDWWLWGKTRSMLAATDDLRDSTIDVDVSNAVVTLTGTVGSAAQKTKAEQTAKGIDGVTRVVNNLKVNANDSVLPNATNTNQSNNAKH